MTVTTGVRGRDGHPDGALAAGLLADVVPGELDAHRHLAQHQPGRDELAPDRVGKVIVEFARTASLAGPA